MIREANNSDVEKITELHFSSQVSGILGKLTSRSLADQFYSPLIADHSILTKVEVDENEDIRGFIAFRKNANRVPFALPNKNLNLVKELLLLIIKSPQNIFLVLNVLRTERKVFQKIKKQRDDVAEIQILIVKKDVQGKGIGSELVVNLFEETRMSEVIVKTQSTKAVEFYKKHGFTENMNSIFVNSTIFVLNYKQGGKDVN
jgi:N-acetylglutamate synthase-like GNAT family acetyltransferase